MADSCMSDLGHAGLDGHDPGRRQSSPAGSATASIVVWMLRNSGRGNKLSVVNHMSP